jgi:hypothetical protein
MKALQVVDSIVAGHGTFEEEVVLVQLMIQASKNGSRTMNGLGDLESAYWGDIAAVLHFLERREDFQDLISRPMVDRADIQRFLEERPALIRTALLHGLFRAAVDDLNVQGLQQIASLFDRAYDFGLLLASAIDAAIADWIEEAEQRLQNARKIIQDLAPPDRSAKANRVVDKVVHSFRFWDRYPHHVLVVPGFTPKEGPGDGLSPLLLERLEKAVEDFEDQQAPFILVSGGNVWAGDLEYYEALEMQDALTDMGMPFERIIVEARARHSTTNLRNAGRYMLRQGMERALVTTTFAQDFYYSFADISTFHARCKLTLGYRVGELEDLPFDPVHSVFEPSQAVFTINYRDPLDP